MRQLKTNFDLQDLVEAGAVTMTPENRPALSPLLAKPGTFIALGTGPDSRPVDLLGQPAKHFPVAGGWLPCLTTTG